MITALLVTALVFGFLLVEARLAAQNERALRERGAVEPPNDVYPVMAVAYPGAFLAMIGEELWRGTPPPLAIVSGLILFGAAKTLKGWAIRSLGSAWTFRVMVVRGSGRVTSGPYRYMRHPNYLAVIGELAGTALMTGACIAGPIGTIGFALLMWRRIGIEDKALDAILPPTYP